MVKQVRVEVVGIQNTNTGDDPGNSLEIYGDLGVWVKLAGSSIETDPDEEHVFMQRAPHEHLSIPSGSIVNIGGSTTTTMTVKENQELWIGGHLREQDDTSADDDLGGHYERFHFPFIPENTTLKVHFRDSSNDQRVAAIFGIKVL